MNREIISYVEILEQKVKDRKITKEKMARLVDKLAEWYSVSQRRQDNDS